jgi:hypothetical protein
MDSFEKKRGNALYVHTKYLPHRENYSVEDPDPEWFLGLPDPDSSINKKKVRKTLISTI